MHPRGTPAVGAALLALSRPWPARAAGGPALASSYRSDAAAPPGSKTACTPSGQVGAFKV